MTRDLEETLSELGPGYREVVDRLVGAYEPVDAESLPRQKKTETSSSDAVSHRVYGDANGFRVYGGHLFRWTAGYLVAASLLVFLGLGIVFRLGLDRSEGYVASSSGRISAKCADTRVYTVAYAADESSLRAIVASQRADGSWANDFITRQNAAALRGAGDAVSLVAYKRALRYLRSRGLEPLTDGELKARADRAARART